MVELSWVTYPVKKIFWGGEKYKDFSQSWEMRRFLKLVKNAEIFQSGEKYRDFSKWSCCNGRLAQVENEKIFSKRWKIQRFFKRKEKYRDFSKGEKYRDFSKCFHGKNLKVVRNARISQKWFYCYGQPAQMEDEKCFERGLITMGDLPRWKAKCLKWHDRTRWGTRAEECTRKEVGLENILPERWVLKGALKKRQGLDNALPKRWGLEGTFKRGGRVRKHTT